jgi:hypothetical protein
MFEANRGKQFRLDRGLHRAGKKEVCMANWMIIRFAALATFSMALVAAPSFTPAFATGERAAAMERDILKKSIAIFAGTRT